MNGDRHELGRRRFLQATGAGLAGATVLSTGVGASSGRQVETAPDEDEYEEILSEMAGDGSEEDPYVITDVVELQAISGDVTAQYELGNDIDASPTADWNDGAGFDPIYHDGSEGDDEPDEESVEEADGDAPAAFTGWLTGNGHEIASLTIDRPDDVGSGLVLINEGAITDLTLTDATIVGDFAGIVAASNAGGIGTVTVDGTVSGNDGVGGITGVNEGLLGNNQAEVDTTGDERVGGLVGRNAGNITESSAAGTVEGTVNTGGLIGQNSGTVMMADADTDVTGTFRVGGFVGELSGMVRASTAAGTVSGKESVGGFAGEHWGEVVSSTASGAVEGEEYVGGLAGTSYGDIRICSFEGDVSGLSAVGGVVGWGTSGNLVANVYTVSSVSGDSSVGSLVGLLGWEFLSESETSQLRQAYWSVDETDHDPVGLLETGDGDVTVDEETIAGLETHQFVGQGAVDHMTEFDFEQQWRALSDEMPIPREQAASQFEIRDISTREISVRQDETFDIELDVENTAEWSGTQTIGILIDGQLFESVEQTLDAGESTRIAFEDLPASDIPVGTYSFAVRTRNDAVEGTIEVTSTGPGGGNGGSDDGDDTSNTPADGADDADDDGPGFGVGAALTGVGTGAYLLARRFGRESSIED